MGNVAYGTAVEHVESLTRHARWPHGRHLSFTKSKRGRTERLNVLFEHNSTELRRTDFCVFVLLIVFIYDVPYCFLRELCKHYFFYNLLYAVVTDT